MKNGERLIKGEFIGKEVQVLDSKIKGIIVDESKNMLLIKSGGKKRKVVKKNHEFIFEFEAHKIKVNGNAIALRPEDRIKIRKWKVEMLD